MSFGIALTIIVLTAVIACALLVGRICHLGDLEKDPLDTPPN